MELLGPCLRRGDLPAFAGWGVIPAKAGIRVYTGLNSPAFHISMILSRGTVLTRRKARRAAFLLRASNGMKTFHVTASAAKQSPTRRIEIASSLRSSQ